MALGVNNYTVIIYGASPIYTMNDLKWLCSLIVSLTVNLSSFSVDSRTAYALSAPAQSNCRLLCTQVNAATRQPNPWRQSGLHAIARSALNRSMLFDKKYSCKKWIDSTLPWRTEISGRAFYVAYQRNVMKLLVQVGIAVVFSSVQYRHV